MIGVFHHKNKVVSIYDFDTKKELSILNSSIIKSLFLLADEFNDRYIIWCNQELKKHLNLHGFNSIFHHKLVMSSFNVTNEIFNNKIGYIEQSVFIKVPKNVVYGTWQMSCDVGGIYSETLKQFKHLQNFKGSFKLFLNYIAKQGILKGLITSSNPNLLVHKEVVKSFTSEKINSRQLFKFVKENYKTSWTYLLFLQLLIYEKKFPLLSFLNTFFSKNISTKDINLEGINVQSNIKNITKEDFSVDVIIPTLKRKKYLKDVLSDLNNQTILPKKVIIVEQNPDKDSISELDYINNNWNFEIDHTFIHQLGACNARNIALSKVTSNFTFFADDDIRFDPNLLEITLNSFNKFETDGIVISSVQKHEKILDKTTQLSPMFGTCSSVVKSSFSNKCSYKKEHEFGYGEDSDFGMQLRNLGAEILYIPKISMLHLKAPIGGFRFKPNFPWEVEKPKPSPTVMAYNLKHLTKEQLLSYKTVLFLKFYKSQSIKNPFTYIKLMKKKWNVSVFWAKKLMSNEV